NLADVPGNVDGATARAGFVRDDGSASRRLADIDLLHGQVRKVGNMEEGLLGAGLRGNMDEPGAADDAARVVEALGERMPAVERDIGVLDDAARTRLVVDPKDIGEAEFLALLAVRRFQRGLV